MRSRVWHVNTWRQTLVVDDNSTAKILKRAITYCLSDDMSVENAVCT